MLIIEFIKKNYMYIELVYIYIYVMVKFFVYTVTIYYSKTFHWTLILVVCKSLG